ncbi:MAG: serine--tRNA ligase [Ferrimicrobium sp.]
MIDLRNLREQPVEISAQLVTRGVSRDLIDQLLSLDDEVRTIISARDELRARVNTLSRQVGELRRQGCIDEAQEAQASSRSLGDELRTLETAVTERTSERDAIWLIIPNIPSPQTPTGTSEDDNVVVRYWLPGTGYITPEEFLLPEVELAHQVPHWETGAALGILDLPRAAKLSGSMFALFRGDGARLLRALTSFALDAHSDAFEEIRPPILVRRDTMVASGNLPKFAEDAYTIERDDLYAIPTSEVPLVSIARDEILDEDTLPRRLTAVTPCFRREAGAAGRDTRGLLRLHEFDKVELVAYSTPADAPEIFSDLLARAESLLQRLGLWYRVVDLCTGDLGQSAARTFDLEVYAPGTGKWLEVSSVSWCSDYQARRANIRYRPQGDSTPRLVHTFNGSALAWPRIWAALVEHYRCEDGTVTVPDALQPYLGTTKLIPNLQKNL